MRRCVLNSKGLPVEAQHSTRRESLSMDFNLVGLRSGNVKLRQSQPAVFHNYASIITKSIICALRHWIPTERRQDPTISTSTGMNLIIGDTFKRRPIVLNLIRIPSLVTVAKSNTGLGTFLMKQLTCINWMKKVSQVNSPVVKSRAEVLRIKYSLKIPLICIHAILS